MKMDEWVEKYKDKSLPLHGRGQRSSPIQLIGSKDLAIEILKSRAARAEADGRAVD